MPRGAEFDDGVPQSDNPIEAGQTLAHGTGAEVRCSHSFSLTTPTLPPVLHTSLLSKHSLNHHSQNTSSVDRSHKAAPLPEGISEMNDRDLSQGSQGITQGTGSGKGGHEPHSLGEGKGMGKHMGDERLDDKIEEKLNK